MASQTPSVPTMCEVRGCGMVKRKTMFKPSDGDQTFYTLHVACLGDTFRLSVGEEDYSQIDETQLVAFEGLLENGKQGLTIRTKVVRGPGAPSRAAA